MGSWMLEVPGQKSEITLEQKFQKLQGTVTLGPVQAGLREPRLHGAEIRFSFVDPAGVRRDLAGRVAGSRMEGTFRDEKGAEGPWSATKK
jgi:hypothetical protein